MRIGFDRRQVVDGDDLDVAAFRLDDGAQNIAANPAESINGHTNGHFPGLLFANGRLPGRCTIKQNSTDSYVCKFHSLFNAVSTTLSAVSPKCRYRSL